MRAFRALALLTACAASVGAGTAGGKTNLPALPPYGGAYQPQTVDERGIWMLADEDEREVRDSKFLIHDAALETYVREVLCRTVGQDRCLGVRVYIERVPAFNANMAPNGKMVVWSGLLLRVRNEAELAAVLGHEFAHFEERHSLLAYKQRRLASDVIMWASFLGNTGYLGNTRSLIQSTALGSVFQYSRAQETSADLKAFSYLAASGYRTGAFADIWARIMDEADATAAGRKRRSQRYDQVAFFSSHPTSLDRATYLRALAVQAGDQGEVDDVRFHAAMAAWLPQFLDDQLKLNDFGGTEYLLGQLAGSDWTPALLYARGELYRMRGNPRDLVAAAQFYRDALAKGATDPAIYRNLGTTLLRNGDAAGGRQALADYLRLQPDASDKAMIATLIQ
jgi:predicted Zn-dependent protease